MSMCWYFHTFPIEKFERLCRHATPSEKRKLFHALTDPNETDFDEEQLVSVRRLGDEVLMQGISYSGKDEEESALLDFVVTTMFSRMGLGKELKLTPVSREPMSVYLAAELQQAARARGAGLLPVVLEGRRYGEHELSHCNYCFLFGDEISRLNAEAESLRTDASLTWKFPDTPKLIGETLIHVLNLALSDPELALYGHLT